jgi:predicted xylose isomerase-like sugar epimerase
MRVTSVGIALIVVGIAIFAFSLVRLINGAALDAQSKVPGIVSVQIDAPGRYYVWDNHWTTFEGERIKYAADCPAEARVTVSDSGGNHLKFTPDASESWSIGNNGKTSIGYIDVELTLKSPHLSA